MAQIAAILDRRARGADSRFDTPGCCLELRVDADATGGLRAKAKWRAMMPGKEKWLGD